MAFQSLYRRFRPQRFGEVIGQAHLVSALQNAVAEERVGHAYLLSGPRGTGKTSTARILAKALNCENLDAAGEPCGTCDSCVSIERGNSMDLVELDAASNNRVENVRELIANAALASPGRRKVYLLDEVHMLSTAASNALLKTLEEPPGHVVFILATTDPQKVLPTIRSRTQHVELSLVSAEELAAHVRHLAELADIAVDDDIVDYVVARGSGSVRDTLSSLDQVVAAGGIPSDRVSVDELLAALAARDLTASLTAVATAVASGVDARDLAERTARQLRDMFLVAADVDPGQLPPAEVEALRELARTMGRPTNVRALELIGASLVDMRQAPDPRLTFEIALVSLFGAGAGSGADDAAGDAASIEALEARVARLEAGGARAAPGSGPPDRELPGSAELASELAALEPPAASTPASAPAITPPNAAGGGAAAARAALAEARGEHQDEPPADAAAPTTPSPTAPTAPPPPPATAAPTPPPPPPAPTPEVAPPVPDPVPTHPEPELPSTAPEAAVEPPPPPEPMADSPREPAPPAEASAPPPPATPPPAPPTAPPASGGVSHALIAEQWPTVIASLTARARARYQAAKLVRLDGSTAVFELPNEVHRDRCEQLRPEVELTLRELIGEHVELALVAGVDDSPDALGQPARGAASDAGGPAPSDEPVDPNELRDAPPDGRSTLDRITDAFPGATVLDDDGSM